MHIGTESIWQKQDAQCGAALARKYMHQTNGLVRWVRSERLARLLPFCIFENSLDTKMCSILLDFSLLDTSFGMDPVPESSHSSINTRLIRLPTFISPAHYSSKIPDISSIWTNQWSSGVTLQEKREIGD